MPLPIKTLKDITPSVRKLHDRALQAIAQKNYPYALEMLHLLLHAEPGFVEGHRILRQTQLDKVGGQPNALRSALAMLTTCIPIQVKGPMLLKQGKAKEALELAEKALDADPTSAAILQFLALAAKECGFAEIAVDALATAAQLYPANLAVLKALSQAYEETEDFQKALATWQQVKQLNPTNSEIDNDLKRLSALAAMKAAKWEKAESYRDIIKDKEQAQTLEQQGRIAAKDEGTLQSLTRATEQEVRQQETNANLLKLADLYRRSKQYAKALATYQRSVEVSGVLDPTVEEAMTDVNSAIFDEQIAALQGQPGQEPRIAELERQRDEMILQRLLKRVERYPNDANYRFDLGEMYWKLELFDKAMQEFQVAQRSPQYRLRALAYMGKCMVKKELHELASEQFKLALEGLEKNDPERKEVLYNLGTTYERLNRPDDALAAFRELYSLDVNYRDIASRMQAYFKKG
ncbi:MAG: tetratricopeptide repeat protein [Lentisphaeria bacterium]|jgi:tetratricopeptide (TPR) repeat protein